MQRIYPVLLSISIALAVAIFLRPKLAEDLTVLAENLLRNIGPVAQAAFGSNGTNVALPSGTPDAAGQPPPRGGPDSWLATPASPSYPAGGNTAAVDGSSAPVWDRPQYQPPEPQPYERQAPQADTRLPPPDAVYAPVVNLPSGNQANPPPDGSLPPPGPSFQPSPQAGQPPGNVSTPPLESVPPPQPPPAGATPPEAQLFERGQIIGRVGSEVILFGEVAMGVEEIRAQYKDRVPAEELEAQISALIKDRLKPKIETKLIYLDAKRTIPRDGFQNLEKRIAEQFEKSEIQNMMKRGKLETRQELEAKLNAMNTSLDQQKRAFTEQIVAHQWLRHKAKSDEEIPYDQMLAYYVEHLASYERPARARWEQLMVRFSRFPSKAAAYQAIAELGNLVWSGKPLAEVAQSGSDGNTARNGGSRDWTSQGSLVSKVLDEAIFALPPGQLSPILEDEQGFHIIRVVQREDAYRVSFREAQVEIRQKIRDLREKDQEQSYLATLQEKTPVWTVFDAPSPYARVSGNSSPPQR